MATNGWASLGEALAGGAARNELAYQQGQTRAAQLASLLAGAQIKRDEAMARDQLQSSIGGVVPDQAQANFLATALRGGFDPTKVSGYTGELQEQGLRGDAVARALAGDWGGANANLMGLARGPVELAAIQGQNLINNRLLPGGGGISTTEQGRASIAADAARATAAYAAANSANAAAQRARDANDIAKATFALQSTGQWNPSGAAGAGGGGAGQAPKLTEQQSKDVVYFTRGREANGLLQAMAGNLTATGGQQGIRGISDTFLRGLPWVGDSQAVNPLISSERQQAEQAAREFLAAILRKDTGAAITQQEFDIYGRTYLPQVGDSPATLQQKARARETALQAIGAGLGPAAAVVPGGVDLRAAMSAGAATSNAPIQVRSAQDYNALPSGSEYVDPNGVRRRKP
ncbi:hypothetical protein [[Pseudomonas] boreopolis]|uniref:Acyltransferase n=1 Tax=Xanthomonas boreopolis TaxID=86183 RepID=A0A919KIM0_9XANT|nr:hypothetical protein GCM10009090_25240 [[Pseudomonas] boreopolis]